MIQFNKKIAIIHFNIQNHICLHHFVCANEIVWKKNSVEEFGVRNFFFQKNYPEFSKNGVKVK